jgi:hypothetical protein
MQFQQPASAVEHQAVRVVKRAQLAVILEEDVPTTRQAQPRILQVELAGLRARQFRPLGHISPKREINQINILGHALLLSSLACAAGRWFSAVACIAAKESTLIVREVETKPQRVPGRRFGKAHRATRYRYLPSGGLPSLTLSVL